jgi:hypothetical protein
VAPYGNGCVHYHLFFSISFQASSLKRRQTFFVHVYREVWKRERIVYDLFNSWIVFAHSK